MNIAIYFADPGAGLLVTLFLIAYLVIALILCLLVSFSVWLVVHYRQDKKQPASTDGEASAAYPIVTADL